MNAVFLRSACLKDTTQQVNNATFKVRKEVENRKNIVSAYRKFASRNLGYSTPMLCDDM